MATPDTAVLHGFDVEHLLADIVRRSPDYEWLDAIPLEQLLSAVFRLAPPQSGKFYPLALFNFLNAYRPASTVEVVCLRETEAGTEVLLRQRAEGDVGYAGTVHAPGSYVLNDETVSDILERIVTRELGPRVSVTEHDFCGVLWDPLEERGHQLHHVFTVEIDGPTDTTKAQWFPVSNLPDNLVDHHHRIIHMAVIVFTGVREPSFVIEEE